MNPVFLREMREAIRQEGKGDSWNLGYLVCAVLLLGAISTAISLGYYHVSAPVGMYYLLAFIETIFVTRGSNAAFSLALERAQNTFESLFLTPLTPARYLRGQLLYNASIVVRRIGQMLPFFGLVYLLGGFSLGPFLGFQLLLIAYSLMSNAALFALSDGVVTADWVSQQLKRSSGRKRIANMNPSVMFAMMIFPFLSSLITTGGQGGNVWSFIIGQTGMSQSGSVNFLRAAAAVHPFFALVLWGDIRLFGFPVPVWLYCLIIWGLMGQASFFTFVYQLTMRRFRYNIGLRLGRWLLFCGMQILIAAVGWEQPVIAMALSLVHMTVYALFRFSIPQRVPVQTEGDSWQRLPRRDLFVNRAGNLFPYFIATMLPAVGVQFLFASRIPLHGIRTALLYIDAEILLCVAAVLLGGQIFQIRSAIAALKKAHTPPSPGFPILNQDEKAGKARPMNPVLGVVLVLWIVPLPIMAIADSLSATPFAHHGLLVKQGLGPILYYNPIRFVFELVSINTGRVYQNLGLILANRSVIVNSRHDYYLTSLAVAALAAVLALYFSTRWSRRYRRALHDWGEQNFGRHT